MKKTMFALLAVTLLFGTFAAAQVNSNTQSVTLNAVIPEFLSVDAISNPVVNFAVTGDGFTPVLGDVTPSWNVNYNLIAGRTVKVCAYMSTQLTGTASGTKMGTGALAAKFNGGSFNYFTSGSMACGFPSGLVASTLTTTTASHTGVIGTTAQLQLSAGGYIPDTYTGTLNIVAQAI